MFQQLELLQARFSFYADPIHIEAEVARPEFEAWIAPELDAIAECVDGLLEETGTEPLRIDRVFLTGGSSFIPAVRQLFADRFGKEKLASSGELTSVATGLAFAARQRFLD